MPDAIAHATYPARIVLDINGEDHEVATFDVRLPVYPKIGETITDEDGHPHTVVSISPPRVGDIEKAVNRALRRRTVLAS